MTEYFAGPLCPLCRGTTYHQRPWATICSTCHPPADAVLPPLVGVADRANRDRGELQDAIRDHIDAQARGDRPD